MVPCGLGHILKSGKADGSGLKKTWREVAQQSRDVKWQILLSATVGEIA
jgi:hypothetical protein